MEYLTGFRGYVVIVYTCLVIIPFRSVIENIAVNTSRLKIVTCRRTFYVFFKCAYKSFSCLKEA